MKSILEFLNKSKIDAKEATLSSGEPILANQIQYLKVNDIVYMIGSSNKFTCYFKIVGFASEHETDSEGIISLNDLWDTYQEGYMPAFKVFKENAKLDPNDDSQLIESNFARLFDLSEDGKLLIYRRYKIKREAEKIYFY